MRIAAVLFWVAAAAVAIAIHLSDAERRGPAAEFVGEYRLDARRATHADAIANAPSADFALLAAADAALQDSIGMVNLSDLDSETRQLWIASVSRFDDELREGSRHLLDAIALRPGWPNHRGVLGEIEFMLARRQMRLADDPQRWLAPLRSAVLASPGKEGFALFAAGASMESWPYLDASTRKEFEPFFRTAMRDPRFVRVAYRDIANLVGHDASARWLPDIAPALRAAMDVEATSSNVAQVAKLFRRWERVEWQSRVSDLKKIKERAQLRDESGLRRACAAWISAHGIGDFDHRDGRRQVTDVLALWPPSPGEWRRDPRANVIQFFLNGRVEDADGAAVYRTISVLTGTPDVVMARGALLAGDEYEAARMARSSETRGAFEWTRFYVELARHHLKEGRNADARAALAEISPAARFECEVALLHALIDRPPAASPVTSDARWSGPNLPLCLAPGAKELEVHLESQEAGVVSFGFDGGRLGTTAVSPGFTMLRVPIVQEGRHIFSLQRVAGPTVAPVRASVR